VIKLFRTWSGTKGVLIMKKILFTCVSLLILVCQIRADDLADLLQDLAIQTACIGMYSSTQANKTDGVINKYPDPPDWYTPQLMATRFAQMSGSMTRTNTFYGICFDYAQFAWDDIKKYQKTYNDAGMKGHEWYIAVADWGDPYTIILYDPVPKEQATRMWNGVYVKEHSRHRVTTHDLTSGHAWLWVQHNDGTWYWIDPTWTDNKGYVWWGMVKNGKEVTYYPDPVYCLANNYPRPPRPDETPAERATRSQNSTYAEYIKYTPQFAGAKISSGLYVGYISAFDFDFFNKYGFIIGWEDHVPYNFGLVGSFSLEYLTNKREHLDSLIVGFTAGYQFFSNFVLYAGGGIGYKLPSDDGWFTWKVNGGLRVQVYRFFTKFDVSYNQIIGPSLGVGLGVFW
jgi:hypothetical protein